MSGRIVSQFSECNFASQNSLLNEHIAVGHSLVRVKLSLLGVTDNTCGCRGPCATVKLLNGELVVGNLDLDFIDRHTCRVVDSDNHVVVGSHISVRSNGAVEVSAVLALAPLPA